MVYASPDPRNHIPTANSCSSHQLPSTQNAPDPDLETLRAILGANGNGTIAGRLTFTTASLATADIPVNLTGAGSITTTAQSRGNDHELFFLFKDLVPGTYTIAANPPPGINVTTGIWPGSRPNPTTFPVDTNSCNEVIWVLRYHSHIRGRVTDTSGQPVANADIALISPRNTDQIARGRFATMKRVKTDADGIYDLPGLDPGDYVVALHPAHPQPPTR